MTEILYKTYVFLYYTEADTSNTVIGNRIYRYELVNNNQQLVNPKLLFDLPGTPSPGGEGNHNGGKIIIGPDHNVYAIIGLQVCHSLVSLSLLTSYAE